MIKDRIENIKLYENLSINFGNAIRFLEQENFLEELKAKKRLDGDGFYVMLQEYETNSDENGRWETHKDHIDIQYILEGEERTGYAGSAKLGRVLESSSEKDFYFYEEPEAADWVIVHSGEFVIFFPTDGHKPALHTKGAAGRVTKAVFKVNV